MKLKEDQFDLEEEISSNRKSNYALKWIGALICATLILAIWGSSSTTVAPFLSSSNTQQSLHTGETTPEGDLYVRELLTNPSSLVNTSRPARAAICAMVTNEENFLQEWLLYHTLLYVIISRYR